MSGFCPCFGHFEDISQLQHLSLVSPTSALPKQFEVTPADLAIHLNDTAMFECQSPGLPTPDVRWFRESVPLTPGPRTHIYPSGVLEVAMVTMADFAQYRCEVSNMERSRFSPFARLSQDLEGELFSPFSPICMFLCLLALFCKRSESSEKCETRMTASTLKEDRNAPKVRKNATFIRTKHNMQISWVIPLMKLQNDT